MNGERKRLSNGTHSTIFLRSTPLLFHTINELWGTSPIAATLCSIPEPRRILRRPDASMLDAVFDMLLRGSSRLMSGRRQSYSTAAAGATLVEKATKRAILDLYVHQDLPPSYTAFVACKVVGPKLGTPAIGLLQALPAHIAQRFADLDMVMTPVVDRDAALAPLAGRSSTLLGEYAEWVR